MEITYRRFDLNNPTEVRFIAEIDMTIPAMYDDEFPVNEELILDRIENFKQFKPDDFLEVAVTQDNRVVGYHFVQKIPYFKKWIGRIYTLWVADDYRRKGIAKALKEHAEIWGRNQNLDHLFTWVHVDNAGMLALNKSMGYEVANIKFKKKL